MWTDTMTPNQRRAHLILHGQTLLDEWQRYCKLMSEGWKLRDEGWKLIGEGWKLGSEEGKLIDDGDKLIREGWKLRDEGVKLRDEGWKLWTDAVKAEFGDIKMTWVDKDCHLANGEVYVYER